MTGEEKKHLLVAAAVLVALCAFYLLTIRPGHNWGGDFAMYIHHAKNIVEGEAYGNTGYIYNPLNSYVGPRSYPVGFPIVLAPVYAVWGFDLHAFKVEIALLLCLSFLVIFLVFRKKLPPPESVLLVLILGMNPYVWANKDRIVSDVPFLLFCYLSIYFIQRIYSRGVEDGRARDVLLAGLCVSLAAVTRSAGYVFLPALLAMDIFVAKRGRRSTLVIFIMAAAALFLQGLITGGGVNYSDQFAFTPAAFAANGIFYLKSLGLLWKNGSSQAVNGFLHLVISIFAVAGFVKSVRKVQFYDVFLVSYYAMVVLWPYHEGLRLLLPIVPIFVFHALSAMSRLRTTGLGKTAWIAVFAMIFASYAGEYSRKDFGPVKGGVEQRDAVDLFQYIRTNTDPGEVFLFFKPRVLSLYTGRRAAGVFYPEHRSELWAYMKEVGVSYLAAGKNDDYLADFTAHYGGFLEKRYSNAMFDVYRVRTDG